MPAFQPYWGKPAVRNDRGGRGNVGIIRSPVRASILPDPLTSTCELTGRSGRRLNNDPGPEGTSGLLGAQAQAARHEPRRLAWGLEAKQISNRVYVTGSR